MALCFLLFPLLALLITLYQDKTGYFRPPHNSCPFFSLSLHFACGIWDIISFSYGLRFQLRSTCDCLVNLYREWIYIFSRMILSTVYAFVYSSQLLVST